MTNEYENPLVPTTPPPEPISEDQLAINFLNSLRIHAADHFDKPNFALFKNGIGFAPLGNIMAICAEAKNGKSWLMQQFVLAMLKGEFCGLTSDMVNPRVLYFDTEQDKYDTKMIQTRVHYVIGWPFEEDNDAFQLYSMDDFDLLKKDQTIQQNRMFAIETAIQVMKPQVVFIDGVRDLIFDFNDLAESATLVQKLMSLARRNNILICTVLHVNPNSDKMRGHLGTEMQNKTTDVFTVKKEDSGGVKQFKVKQIAARHQDVEDWTFWINDQGKFHLPELVEADGTLSTTETTYTEDTATVHNNMLAVLNTIFNEYVEQLNTADFEDAIRNAVKVVGLSGGKGSDYTVEKVKQYFISNNMVETTPGNRGATIYSKTPF